MTVKHLDHLNMTVHDLEETAAWYGRVFGFVVVERGRTRDGTPFAILRSGEAMLCVYEHPERGRLTDEARDDLPVHGLSHFALRITDGAAWERTVAAQGLEVRYGGAVRWPRSTSWYVCDPSGYELEVVLWNDDTIRF